MPEDGYEAFEQATALRRSRAPRRAKAWRVLRAIVEIGAASVVIALAASPWLASLAWPIDLIANFTAQALFLTGALTAWALLFRRWKLLAVVLLAGLTQVGVLAGGRARWAGPAASDADEIRVLHYNVNPFNPRADEAITLIESCSADLICILEPPRDLIAFIIQQQGFRATHPYMTGRSPKDYANWQFVLSKWPTREYPNGIDEFGEPPLMALVVEHPRKPFGLVLIHPASPRNARRWAAGNRLVAAAADVVKRMRAEGLEVVLTADLNGSPTGGRARRLVHDTDLRRCKPLWRADGTFPAGLSWPASILLDDVWVSAGLRAASWDTVDGAGSDHSAVLATVAPAP